MTFHTRIPIEECKVRLASGVDAERLAISWSGYAGSKPILGKIRDTSFRLQKRRYYHNSFAPFFYGRFVASGRETLIEGAFKMRPDVKVFIIVWFSFLAFLSVDTLVSAISGRGGVEGNPALDLVIPGLAAFMVALIKFGQWLGRSEERAIVAFLESTFEARRSAGP